MNIKAFKTVYSYMWPEVRNIVTETFTSSDFIYRTRSSTGNKDDVHKDILKKYIRRHEHNILGLNNFEYSYPTAGSEEGIRESLTMLRKMGVKDIYVLKGEYEGYRYVAESRGINTIEVDIDSTHPEELGRGWFFVSNPSARDGNIISNDIIDIICDNHNVFYDIAYYEGCRPFIHNVNHDKMKIVVMSYSKPYGLFYYRVGALFSRIDIPSLTGNKWFKSIPSLLLMNSIMNNIGPNDIYKRYRVIQKEITEQISSEIDVQLYPSDSLLIAFKKKEGPINKSDKLSDYLRHDTYRLCLTPYYKEILR